MDVFESCCKKKKVWKVCKSVSREWLCGYWTDFCDWYVIKSGSFCLHTDCMLLQALFYFDSGDQIFLTALLSVIYISDSTMPMQEIVISFEEVTQTKLKVKLQFSIFYAIFKYWKRLAFQAKVFFSNSWFIARFRSLRNLLLMFYF